MTRRIFWVGSVLVLIASGSFAQMHGGMMHGAAATAPTSEFGRSVEGLPLAKSTASVALGDGDTFELTAAPVRKELPSGPVRMYAYNGSVPGPLLKVRQGSSLVVRFKNEIDLESTVHWHGVRVENRYDGVPGVTQRPVSPGDGYEYRLTFPDAGLFWYHPHVREDYTQELGLYGGILVEPASPWPVVDREVVLFLDDLRLLDDDVEPFLRDGVTHTMSGRFGNLMLVNGETHVTLEVEQGERVRFYLANAANTRTFAVSVERHSMKIVGSDGGLVPRETMASSVVLGPSERSIFDVMFQSAGSFRLVHETPERRVSLGTVVVRASRFDDSVAPSFFRLRDEPGSDADLVNLLSELPATPDYLLELISRSEMGAMGAMGMMGAESGAIEWEEDEMMALMNEMSTEENVRWSIRDQLTGAEGMDLVMRATVGDAMLLRIANSRESDHAMQHPIHLHGQRFVVVSKDGDPDPYPAWKDTVLIPAGSTYDLLVEFSGEGEWLLHCHIPEHMESGMMSLISVAKEG